MCLVRVYKIFRGLAQAGVFKGPGWVQNLASGLPSSRNPAAAAKSRSGRPCAAASLAGSCACTHASRCRAALARTLGFLCPAHASSADATCSRNYSGNKARIMR